MKPFSQSLSLDERTARGTMSLSSFVATAMLAMYGQLILSIDSVWHPSQFVTLHGVGEFTRRVVPAGLLALVAFSSVLFAYMHGWVRPLNGDPLQLEEFDATKLRKAIQVPKPLAGPCTLAVIGTPLVFVLGLHGTALLIALVSASFSTLIMGIGVWFLPWKCGNPTGTKEVSPALT